MGDSYSWVGWHGDLREGDNAKEALMGRNDSGFYESISRGIDSVPRQRWEQAQAFEREGWMKHWDYAASDRNEEHSLLFDHYQALPLSLGIVLEVGCGPFTQLITICGTGRQVDYVHLLDPLLKDYLRHTNCNYKNGQFMGKPTSTHPYQAEALDKKDAFNTIICINVLEHVQNAGEVLARMWNALRPRGHLVFGERYHRDFDPMRSFDIGHPIVVSKGLLDDFAAGFEMKYRRNYYFIGMKR